MLCFFGQRSRKSLARFCTVPPPQGTVPIPALRSPLNTKGFFSCHIFHHAKNNPCKRRVASRKRHVIGHRLFVLLARNRRTRRKNNFTQPWGPTQKRPAPETNPHLFNNRPVEKQEEEKSQRGELKGEKEMRACSGTRPFPAALDAHAPRFKKSSHFRSPPTTVQCRKRDTKRAKNSAYKPRR